jgi:hypothetical protein
MSEGEEKYKNVKKHKMNMAHSSKANEVHGSLIHQSMLSCQDL